MAAPFNVQPNPGAADAGVAVVDKAGNVTISGSLAVTKGAVLLGTVAAAPPPAPGVLQLYSTDGVTLSMGGAGGQAAAQSIPGTLSVTGLTTLAGGANLNGYSQVNASFGVTGTATVLGVLNANGGVDTAASAPAITPTFANGTAAQLSDLTRDYMVYFQVGTVGTAFTLAIGPTSGVANTIMTSATLGADESLSFRLPAGWFVKWAGWFVKWAGTGTTLANQLAIGC